MAAILKIPYCLYTFLSCPLPCAVRCKIVGDPRWLRDWNSVFSHVACLIGNVEKFKGGDKNCWQKKKEKRSCCQCCWHIFISIATSLGSYKILSFHLEQLLAGSLCNRLMILKLEWKLASCFHVWQSKVEDGSQHGSCISFTVKL